MALDFIAETLLPRLLAASIQSTLLVGLVWGVCRALPRLSAASRCWLWWLVALQLLVGLLWASPLALPLLPSPAPTEVIAAAGSVVGSATPSWLGSPLAAPAVSDPAGVPSWSWPALISMFWLLGLSAMITRSVRGYWQTQQLLRESSACHDSALTQAMQLAAEAHGLRAAPRLRLSAAIDSPQLVGPWRPVLLLPTQRLASLHADELDMALTHELVHLQRRDLWWGLLPALAQHLFFFHPLVHLANREYAFAREAACDAAVLNGGPHCAQDYARLLLRLGIAPRPQAGLASASPTFRILKRRLLMLHHTASLPKAAAALILGLIGVVGVMPYRLTNAQAATAAPTVPVQPVAAIPGPAVSATRAAPAAPLPVPAPVMKPAPAPKPAAAPAAPTAPAAPAKAAPAATTAATGPASPGLRGVFTLSPKPGPSAFVLMSEDGSVAHAAERDLHEARALRRGNEPLLWLRRGDSRYVVRDAASLQRIGAIYAETMRLGQAQGALGEQQGSLGQQQGALGEQQGELGLRIAEAATLAARRALAGQPASSAKTAALQARQQDLERKMGALTTRQASLGKEQAALALKQRAATARAEHEARELIEQSIANGLAQPIIR